MAASRPLGHLYLAFEQDGAVIGICPEDVVEAERAVGKAGVEILRRSGEASGKAEQKRGDCAGRYAHHRGKFDNKELYVCFVRAS
jgi:hypothetical protein